MNLKFIPLSILCVAFVTACGGGGGGTDNASGTNQAFNVAVIGDSPYGIALGDVAQYNANPAFITAIGKDPSISLALHVGDIHSGKEYCTEAFNFGVLSQWKGFNIPVLYTPGDNEWADCNKSKQGGGTYSAATGLISYVANGSYAGGDPLANLSLVRSLFFPNAGKSQGSQVAVNSQALLFNTANPADAQYVENTWYEKNGVMFVSINVPGGSNNDTDPWYGAPTMSNAQSTEVATRTAANLRWLDAAFSRANANNSIAVVINLQADMWDQDGSSLGKAHLTQYKPFIDKIATRTLEFAKPVLLVNGDSHAYRSDNPLVPKAKCVVEQLTTGTVDAALVAATKAVACDDPSVITAMSTYHADVYGTANATTDPYANQPHGYNVPNFRRITAHANGANPLEFVKLTIDPTKNVPNGIDAFGPFSWTRVVP